ncbi:MAG: adenylate kinase [Bacteroidales bacterium]|jgi:adenylate kinase|nr:adenylate kinase [Bacteroidales bacterium]
MFAIAISGPPGAGKGTQSKYIIQEFDFEYISTGEALRKEMELSTEIGKQITEIMDKGHLVSDEIVTDIVRRVVKESKKVEAKGILFDGYPRTVNQAISFDEIMKEYNVDFIGMIDLEVSEKTLIKRILARGKTSGRHDDNEESIKHRLNEYYVKTKPVIDYYKKTGKYFAVNGEGNITEIHLQMKNFIDKYIYS